MTRESITAEIQNFVVGCDRGSLPGSKWREPLVGFADAASADLAKLIILVDPSHELPGDVLADARIIIAYFVPFSEAVITSNGGEGLASPEWAMVYEETNAMIQKLNVHMTAYLNREGYRASVSKEAAVFDREKILSRWSQRHIAYLAGLGTFGLNNMLITEAGCCGRFGTLVTNLDLAPDTPLQTEYCLFKRNGKCRACVGRCPTGALGADRFDRRRCYDRCMENARVYTQYGNSYASEAGGELTDSGSEVCGKCLVGLPCSMKKPYAE